MRSKLIYILFFVFAFGSHHSQNRKIDSLCTVLSALKEVNVDTPKIILLNSLSREYISAGLYLRSDSINRLSLKLSESLNSTSNERVVRAAKTGILNALTNSGVAFWYQGNYSKALTYYFKALAIAEQLNDKFFISRCYANIGLVYFDQKNPDKALEYDLKALKLKKEIGHKRAVAILLSNIGQIYSGKKDFENAMSCFVESLKLDEALDNNKGLIALNYSNIAGVYSLKNDHEKSISNFFRALKIAEEINDKFLISATECNIGGLYIGLKDHKTAEEYLLRSLNIAGAIGNLSVKKEAYSKLSELYAQQQKWDRSLSAYKQFIAVRDSVFNAESTKQSVRTEMNYEFDKKEEAARIEQEKKDALAKEEKEKQNIIRNSFIGGFAFVLLLALLILRGYRNKQKANTIISKQKEEVELAKKIIEDQKLEVEEKQKEVLDSIHYAKRIQTALITSEKYFEKNLNRLNVD